MNVFSLDTKTMGLCKLDATNATLRAQFSSRFLESYNDAYERVMRDKWKLWTTEAVTLDADKCFLMSALTYDCITIRKVTLYQDFSEDAGYAYGDKYNFYDKDGNGTIYVYGAEASGTVYVEYQYMPDRLAITYNISGANTVKVIPVDEAITSAQATALVGKTLHVVDVSTGIAYAYTVASSAAGAAGAATITTSESISVAVADGDQIYIDDEWEPQFDAAYHAALCYYAAYEYFEGRGVNYISKAMEMLQNFERHYGRIRRDTGVKQEMKNCYSAL